MSKYTCSKCGTEFNYLGADDICEQCELNSVFDPVMVSFPAHIEWIQESDGGGVTFHFPLTSVHWTLDDIKKDPAIFIKALREAVAIEQDEAYLSHLEIDKSTPTTSIKPISKFAEDAPYNAWFPEFPDKTDKTNDPDA